MAGYAIRVKASVEKDVAALPTGSHSPHSPEN